MSTPMSACEMARLRSVDVRGVTGNGQAVVAQTTNRGASGTVTLTSSDAGSLARFANIYSRIRGGLLNLALTTSNGSDWSGSLDLRNFAVVNEAKLQDIVATPTGEDGRSLNNAVRRNIDVSSEKIPAGLCAHRLCQRRGCRRERRCARRADRRDVPGALEGPERPHGHDRHLHAAGLA